MSAMSDEEQLDTAKSFFKKYGSTLLSAVLIALIAFFGWEYWKKKNLGEDQLRTAKLQLFLDDAKAAEKDPKSTPMLVSSAEKILNEDPNSVHAIQTQFVMAKLAYEKKDYAQAERELKKVANSEIKDAGLKQIVQIRLADAQLAQKKYDEALKTLANVTEPAFQTTVEEARGDIYVAKNDLANAKKSYQSAWDNLTKNKEERQILQIKLESVGILVEDPEIERPILDIQMDES